MDKKHTEEKGRSGRGRKKQFTERLQLPLPEGTTARMDALLEENEFRLDLIRLAIEKELKRRTKKRS
ncbi:hypothetical protein [Oryzifoliimicrobium ureilyticus]|uniref:hypothetical protein n=1 Tax=Oryzifoliimicrobium ureilyticus TaxID=3113724 RepID=UPI0030767098